MNARFEDLINACLKMAYYNNKLLSGSILISLTAPTIVFAQTEVDRALVALPDFKSGVAG